MLRLPLWTLLCGYVLLGCSAVQPPLNAALTVTPTLILILTLTPALAPTLTLTLTQFGLEGFFLGLGSRCLWSGAII